MLWVPKPYLMASKRHREKRRLGNRKKQCPYCGYKFELRKGSTCQNYDYCRAGMSYRQFEAMKRARFARTPESEVHRELRYRTALAQGRRVVIEDAVGEGGNLG